MDKWVLKNNTGDFSQISKNFGISEELARIIVFRGNDTKEKINDFLFMNMSMLHSPLLLDDMDKAVGILKEKINSKAHIRVVGDYDVDGITSTYTLITALEKLGANVDYVIPDRIKDGYGINIEIIDSAIKDKVDTILTCDNGIVAISQIEYAKKNNITVIVTDHHDIVYEDTNEGRKYILPDADAVINPHKPGSIYPYDKICGAMVAFKLVCQLFDEYMVEADAIDDFIEIACLGTVCDVMPLLNENRVIVREGLKRMVNTKNIGLKNLILFSGALKSGKENLSVYHLGFIIGPCLNATGRLKTATMAIELLRCKDEFKAQELAKELVKLNVERKQMTEESTDRVLRSIENSTLKDDKVIVAYDKECHESLAGIIAGRVKEKYNRPVIVITDAQGQCKGSGRSIESYNIYEGLNACKDLMNKFGGHPMAAGISLDEANIDSLRKKLNDNCTLSKEDFVNKIIIDVVKDPCSFTMAAVKELDLLEPCGTGNERPIFAARNVGIKKAYVVGKERQILKLDLYTDNSDFTCSAVYFGDIATFDKDIYDKFGSENWEKVYKGFENDIRISILYSPQINEYNGRKSIQISIKGYLC